MIRIYISKGNGKTLTAIGTVLKEVERGNKVVFTQFLTNGEDSELKMLQKNNHVAVLLPEAVNQNFSEMNEIQKTVTQRNMAEHYERIVSLVKTKCCDMLVLDRILDVCDYGLIERTELIQFLKDIGDKMEIVLTGERVTHEVMEIMDYVTDIRRINDVDAQFYIGVQETTHAIQTT